MSLRFENLDGYEWWLLDIYCPTTRWLRKSFFFELTEELLKKYIWEHLEVMFLLLVVGWGFSIIRLLRPT